MENFKRPAPAHSPHPKKNKTKKKNKQKNKTKKFSCHFGDGFFMVGCLPYHKPLFPELLQSWCR